MPLADLDKELSEILTSNECKVKNDERKNFSGKFSVTMPDEKTIHVMMSVCGSVGSVTVTQLRYRIDF